MEKKSCVLCNSDKGQALRDRLVLIDLTRSISIHTENKEKSGCKYTKCVCRLYSYKLLQRSRHLITQTSHEVEKTMQINNSAQDFIIFHLQYINKLLLVHKVYFATNKTNQRTVPMHSK
jgi:hypothetical protein